MRQFLRNNGLSIVLFALFALFFCGQTATGWFEENNQRREHQQAPLSLGDYVTSGSFVEVTTENWESEFLQMFSYVLLTVYLFQRGSSESKSPDEPEEVDREPDPNRAGAPAPVRMSKWIVRLYQSSLSLAFLALFAASFALHAMGGTANVNDERALHGESPLTVWQYLATSRFWFESFQNWQSEFLTIFAMVGLSIFLRQKGSPESKPVDAPHSQTGA